MVIADTARMRRDLAMVNPSTELVHSGRTIDAWRAVAAAPDTGIAFRADVMAYGVADVRPPFA